MPVGSEQASMPPGQLMVFRPLLTRQGLSSPCAKAPLSSRVPGTQDSGVDSKQMNAHQRDTAHSSLQNCFQHLCPCHPSHNQQRIIREPQIIHQELGKIRFETTGNTILSLYQPEQQMAQKLHYSGQFTQTLRFSRRGLVGHTEPYGYLAGLPKIYEKCVSQTCVCERTQTMLISIPINTSLEKFM